MDWNEIFGKGASAANDLFSTQEMRDSEKIGKLKDIYLNELFEFKNHTFKVNDDEEMEQLMESIKLNGVIQPLIAFYNEENRLEIIAGHRRKRACERLGLETVPVLIKDMDRDSAIIAMGETNIKTRDKILPSEKGFTYKAMLGALNRQGKRSDLFNSESDERSDSKLSKKVNESSANIHRYIRLTELVQILLDLVDKGKIGLRTAVEISYLNDNIQNSIAEICLEESLTPSYAQAHKMRKLQKENLLDEQGVATIMLEPKPNQKEGFKIANDEIDELLSGCKTQSEKVNRIIMALKLLEKQERIKGKNNEEFLEK